MSHGVMAALHETEYDLELADGLGVCIGLFTLDGRGSEMDLKETEKMHGLNSFEKKCLIFWLAESGYLKGQVPGTWLAPIWERYNRKVQELNRTAHLHEWLMRLEDAGVLTHEWRTGKYTFSSNAESIVPAKTFDELAQMHNARGFFYTLTERGRQLADELDDAFYDRYTRIFPNGDEFCS